MPVIRLQGSNTSIFSSKSTAKGDLLGNLAENCCFGYFGSCLTYFRALSLRRNLRLASSGVPKSYFTRNRRYEREHETSTKRENENKNPSET